MGKLIRSGYKGAFGRDRMNDADAAAREAADEMGRIWVGTCRPVVGIMGAN